MALSCARVRDLAAGFVLGALDIDEMNAVRDHLAACEKDHAEFDELGGVVSYLAVVVEPMEPPAWLRESVMAAADADLRARRRPAIERVERAQPAAIPVAPVMAPVSAPRPIFASSDADVIPFAGSAERQRRRLRDRRPPVWLTRVAAAVAVLAIGGYGAMVQMGVGASHPKDPPWYAIGPGSHQAVISPEGDSTASGILVLQPSGHVYCYVHGLAATSGDQAYVVWLSVDGAPVAKAGVMTVDGTGSGLLEYDESVPNGTLTVQVTREDRGDAVKPKGVLMASGTIALFSPAAVIRPG